MMFQEEYKKAYDEIKAENSSVNEIFARAEGKNVYKKKKKNWKPVVVTFLVVMTLFVGVNISAIAKENTKLLDLYEAGVLDYTTYKSLQRNCPNLKTFVPENASVSKDGIIVTVEAVIFYKREFAIIYSLANEEGYDLIKANEEGEYDWYDVSVSFNGKELELGNTIYWKYDGEKAYYKYVAYRDTAAYPEGETVNLQIRGRYKTEWREETFDLSDVVLEADTKVVKLINSRVNEEFVKVENDDFPYMASVLNMTPLSEIKVGEASVTGIAYIDDVLRVQFCFLDHDVSNELHEGASVYYVNKDGERIFLEASEGLNWYEKINGELLEFREMYYEIPQEMVRDFSMGVEYWEMRGGLNTVWDAEFVVEKWWN